MGVWFPGGGGIELLHQPSDGRLTLLSFDGENRIVAPRLETGGHVYLPAQIEPSILRGITLPSACADFGSTADLFKAVREPFSNHGFREEVALPAAYFIFSTWFPDCSPTAPFLVIAGPKPEATLLLRLIGCMVRHPLRLAEVTRPALCCLPLNLQLTLLISDESASRSARSLLAASNDRGALISWQGGLIDLYCAKAVYRGLVLDDGKLHGTALQIHVPPFRGRLPILDANAQREITEKIQPWMEEYRCRNLAKVCESRFDVPELESRLRILARVLGASIVDAPELQAELAPLLRCSAQQARAERWRDPPCVTVESLLSFTHFDATAKVYIGEIAQKAIAILKWRGVAVSFEPETIGAIVRQLGFTPKRDNRGFAIYLDDRVRRRIHELAREYDVAAVQEGIAQCALCAEIFSEASQSAFDSGPANNGSAATSSR